MSRLLVPLMFLLFATAPAFAQALSPVRYLPGDDRLGAAPLQQDQPAIARGEDLFLAVWRDYRTGGSELILDEGGADIFAARLDADGTVLDTTPIPISQAAADQTDPEVAWNGRHWLVVWQTQVPTESFWAAALHAVRVAPDGEVLDAEPIEIFAYPFSSSLDFGLASDGTDWAIAVRGSSAGENDLVGVRIGLDGTVLDPAGVVLVRGGGSLFFSVGLAFAADTYLLTYTDGPFKGQRLSSDLQLLGGVFTITTNQVGTNPASNGDGFFALSTSAEGAVRRLYGHRIGVDGTVLDPGGLLIVEGVFTGPSFPRAAWGGSAWFATYWTFDFNVGDRLWGARVSTDGSVLDPGGTVISETEAASRPTAVTGAPGGGVRVVFEDSRPPTGASDVVTFSLSESLEAGPIAAVALGAPAQLGADVAVHAGGSLLVFRSVRSDEERILGHPLDADGVPLLAEPVELGTGPQLHDPQVAWNGSVYLVTWSAGDQYGDVVARRVAPDGTPVDPQPVVLMEGFAPDVAALGDDFLVVGIQVTIGTEIQEPLGMRIDGSTGTVLDSTPLDLGANHTRAVSLTAVGDRWLLAYQRNFSHDNPNAEIRGVLIEPGGTVESSFTVSAGANPFHFDPALASDGASAFAVWEESDADQDNVYGRVIQVDGTLLPRVTVGAAADRQTDAAVGWDGEQYVALFQDLRDVTFFLDERSDVFGTRIGADGDVLDPSGFAAFGDEISEVDPAVGGKGGTALLAASDFRDDAPYMAYRLAYRFLGAGTTAEEPAGVVSAESGLALGAPFPNPSRDRSVLMLSLDKPQRVTVVVHDALGRRVTVLHDGPLDADGPHRFTVEAAGLPSGLYLIRASGEDATDAKRVAIVR
jgi:hypothetical protein